MTIHRRSDTSGFALLARNRLSMVLVAVVLAAGCGGSASQTAAPVGPASIAQSPATAETSATTGAASAVPTTTVVPSAEPELTLVAVGDSIPFNSTSGLPGLHRVRGSLRRCAGGCDGQDRRGPQPVAAHRPPGPGAAR